ncbi:MAG TPA: acetylxylan esterase, partial [Pirellulales bacterium]
MWARWLLVVALLGAFPNSSRAADWDLPPDLLRQFNGLLDANREFDARLNAETAESWSQRKDELREQLGEMLGTKYQDRNSDLKPVVTGTVETPSYKVENIHFQSRPGLYVTGNLYLPKTISKPCPAILYVCGHGPFVRNGVAYGNKVTYRHHGDWFARNGYVCLIIDTLQLGEIGGKHHGTYGVKKGDAWEYEWWWASRGYTPAGVEAWNAVRAIDYLCTRPEVDPQRLGVTGRSGGGASSWWAAALDERIKVAVPVAGITNLDDHVLAGCIEGHCDCMFFTNSHRWDYGTLAALVAPRPMLFSNTDRDPIFPLSGVIPVHHSARRIYQTLKADDKLGLCITSGPHKDTQELRCAAFRWFNEHLKGETGLIVENEPEAIEYQQLKVFAELPADEKNTRIQEEFIPVGQFLPTPTSKDQLKEFAGKLTAKLQETIFQGWKPQAVSQPKLENDETKFGIRFRSYRFHADGATERPLTLHLIEPEAKPAGEAARSVVLETLDEAGWQQHAKNVAALLDATDPAAMAAGPLGKAILDKKQALAFLAPRGVGPGAWSVDERKMNAIRRRYLVLGRTLEA